MLIWLVYLKNRLRSDMLLTYVIYELLHVISFMLHKFFMESYNRY